MVCPMCFERVRNPYVKESLVRGRKSDGMMVCNIIECPNCGGSFTRILKAGIAVPDDILFKVPMGEFDRDKVVKETQPGEL